MEMHCFIQCPGWGHWGLFGAYGAYGPFLCPSLCIALCELQMEQLGCLPLASCCNVLPGFPLWDPGMAFPDRVWM